MIQLSEATAIGLHAMIYIAGKKNETLSLKEIAKKFDISEHHLSKVLQRLVKAGYLYSVKGPKGGFRLEAGKEKTSFMEIYETLEGCHCIKECLFNCKKTAGCCCIMSGLLTQLNKDFTDYMQSHDISSFKI